MDSSTFTRLIGGCDCPNNARCRSSAWARSLQFGESHYALAQYSTSRTSRNSPLVEYLGYAPPTVAAGLIDDDGCITAVSKNVVEVVGETAESLIGRPLLTDHEQKRLRERLEAVEARVH